MNPDNDIEYLREYYKILRARLEILRELSRVDSELKTTIKHVSDLFHLKNTNMGSKLMKLGIASFFLPVPIVSEVFGGLLIVSGYMLKKIQDKPYLEDFLKQLDYTFYEIIRLKESIEKGI